MRLVATIAARLIKLALAAAILAVGMILLAPAWTGGWPVARFLAPFIAWLVSILPVDRIWWGVLVVALGGASLLAALPRKTVGRSRMRTQAIFPPAAEPTSFDSQTVEAPHLEPVLYEPSPMQTVGATHIDETTEHAAAPAPWDFPSAHPVRTDDATRIEPELAIIHPPTDLAERLSSGAPDAEEAEPDAISPHEDALAALEGPTIA